MKETFLITGATGLVGGYLTEKLTARGYDYIAVSTNPKSAEKKLTGYKKIVSYDDIGELVNENFKAVINLAGTNLGSKRWTDVAKKDFYDSRINTTLSLVRLIEKMAEKPGSLISASGVDYYGDTGEKEMFEDAKPAAGFLGKLTNDWEQAALQAEKYGVRTVVLRTGFVLAGDSDAVKKLLLPVKMFVGGPLGSGRQFVSWVHIDDLTEIYLFAAENNSLSGIYNATAPEPVTNAVLTREAAKLLGRPAILPAPAFMIKAAVGEMAAVVLEGRKAMPNKLINAGYKFRFTDIIDAWKDVLNDKL